MTLPQREWAVKKLLRSLNREGYHTGKQQQWGQTTVHKVLTNEAYCGTLVWGGRSEHEAIRSGIPPIRVENAWSAIINRETFDNIRQKMGNNAPKAVHPRVVASFYLLSGLLYCSCGHAMIGRSAKSHQYYYYVCNRGNKQGKESCNARNLPKEKIEKLVIEQIKQRVLTPEYLEGLVKMVNEELDSTHGLAKDKLDAIDLELEDARARLAKLYDVLETGKLSLDDLSPRIKELKAKQDGLMKIRVQTEADMVLEGVQHVNAETVKSYAHDLRILLEDADYIQSKAFLRSFVKKIIINGKTAKIQYHLPMPPDGKRIQEIEVLPTNTLGGAEGIRTPYPFLAKEMLSRMSYSPMKHYYINTKLVRAIKTIEISKTQKTKLRVWASFSGIYCIMLGEVCHSAGIEPLYPA